MNSVQTFRVHCEIEGRIFLRSEPFLTQGDAEVHAQMLRDLPGSHRTEPLTVAVCPYETTYLPNATITATGAAVGGNFDRKMWIGAVRDARQVGGTIQGIVSYQGEKMAVEHIAGQEWQVIALLGPRKAWPRRHRPRFNRDLPKMARKLQDFYSSGELRQLVEYLLEVI